jgi:hypothetical protein
MKLRKSQVALFSFILVMPIFLNLALLNPTGAQTSPDVYFGVAMGYAPLNAPTAAISLINKISNYTNLFLVGTTGITRNAATLSPVLQHAYDKGLSFLSFIPTRYPTNSSDWLNYAETSWGDHLLGFMCPPEDEPGGQQLDQRSGRPVSIFRTDPGYVGNLSDYVASNYTEAAPKYENQLSALLSGYSQGVNRTTFPLFTSDYALYWFDYKGGYNGVFAEFGWNYSRQLNVALCRGAAQAQNKEWGVILTYTYTVAPFLESGPELYDDMVTAYNSGAKYILVFDSSPGYTYDILQPEHLEAMQRFWQYIQDNPRNSTPVSSRTAFVLPYGYAYGFRGPEDKIWGLWAADAFSYNMSVIVGNMLEKYGDKLDIIYDDGLQPNSSWGYNELIYWNSSGLLPSPSPTPTPSPSPSPTQTPTPTPTPTPIATPTLTPTPSATSTPSPTEDPPLSPSPSPTQTPTTTPSNSPNPSINPSPSIPPSQPPTPTITTSPSTTTQPTAMPDQKDYSFSIQFLCALIVSVPSLFLIGILLFLRKFRADSVSKLGA